MKKRAALHLTILALLTLLMQGGAGQGVSRAQGQESRAGLVVQFADGSVKTYCFPFQGETISGLDLLLKTGLEVKVEAYGGMGGMVCKIGPDGCDYPEQHCACQSFGPGGVYWSYHHLKGGESRWRTSVAGSGSYKVRDGDVEGWAWSSGGPPPLYTFAQVCSAAQPGPTGTAPPPPPPPVATATPTSRPPESTPTPRPQPTSTQRRPTATPTRPAPTDTPRANPSPTARVEPPTPIPTVTPTAALTETLAPAPTDIPTNTPTQEPTFTSTPLPTSSPTATTTSTPTLIQTTIPAPSPQPLAPATIAIAAGVASALGVVLLSLLARSRRGTGRNGGTGGE